MIFKDYIKDYDYWGHCDLDLIWGNLEKTFIDNKIYLFDKFFTLGHLSLYKNTPEVNIRILEKGGKFDYSEIYSTNEVLRADEMWGIIPIYLNNGYPFFKKKLFSDITIMRKRYTLACNSYEKGEKLVNYKHQVLFWKEGSIYRAGINGKNIVIDEFSYIHFQQRDNYSVSFDEHNVKSFFITSKGFVPFEFPLTRTIVKKYGGYRGAILEWWEINRWRILGWIRERIEIYLKR